MELGATLDSWPARDRPRQSVLPSSDLNAVVLIQDHFRLRSISRDISMKSSSVQRPKVDPPMAILFSDHVVSAYLPLVQYTHPRLRAMMDPARCCDQRWIHAQEGHSTKHFQIGIATGGWAEIVRKRYRLGTALSLRNGAPQQAMTAMICNVGCGPIGPHVMHGPR